MVPICIRKPQTALQEQSMHTTLCMGTGAAQGLEQCLQPHEVARAKEEVEVHGAGVV